MVKHSKNRNVLEGSKAPTLVDEIDTTIIVGEEQFEDDHTNHHLALTEKQMFEQRMLEMESLFRAVVHDNTNLKARLKGLELKKSCVNVSAARDIAIPPASDYQHTSTSIYKEKKIVKPPRPLSPV